MATLHLLGTGAALSSLDRTTTMLAVQNAGSVVLVDCGGDVIQRLLAAGLDPGSIRALILTHEHPDHVSGFPLFMEKLWLAGKHARIPVRGPDPALETARRALAAFDTSRWQGMPEVEWGAVALEEGAEVWSDAEWRITAAPGRHSVPVIGLRFEARPDGGTVTYSADTAPSESIERLAQGTDILVHEATGDFPGHADVSAAAGVAARSRANRLVLVHLPPDIPVREVESAGRVFADLELGADGTRYEF
jgi:ribonuclease Z